MKKYLFFAVSTLLFVFVAASPGMAQSALSDNWTGGFWLEENWVAVIDDSIAKKKIRAAKPTSCSLRTAAAKK